MYHTDIHGHMLLLFYIYSKTPMQAVKRVWTSLAAQRKMVRMKSCEIQEMAVMVSHGQSYNSDQFVLLHPSFSTNQYKFTWNCYLP